MLNKEFKPWKQYVMSRVQEIRVHTTPESWRFCPGNQNPADILSWGMSASGLVSERRWWNGPEFLFKNERERPQEDNIQFDNENTWKEIIQHTATSTHTLITSTQVTQIGVHQIIDVNQLLLIQENVVARFRLGTVMPVSVKYLKRKLLEY